MAFGGIELVRAWPTSGFLPSTPMKTATAA